MTDRERIHKFRIYFTVLITALMCLFTVSCTQLVWCIFPSTRDTFWMILTPLLMLGVLVFMSYGYKLYALFLEETRLWEEDDNE